MSGQQIQFDKFDLSKGEFVSTYPRLQYREEEIKTMKYDYNCLNEKCKDYKKVIVLTHPMSAPKEKVCPCCKKETLERKLEATPHIYKTGGFYKTGG